MCYTQRYDVKERHLYVQQDDGWSWVCTGIEDRFHSPGGFLLDTWFDFSYCEGAIPFGKWAGFLHSIQQAPITPFAHQTKRLFVQSPGLRNLDAIVHEQLFQTLAGRCLGIFTLSTANAVFLRQHIACPVTPLICPLPTPQKLFSWEAFAQSSPTLLQVGQYMRNYDSFFSLETNYNKVLLGKDFEEESHLYNVGNCIIYKWLSFHDFDELRLRCVTYLDHYGEFACTALVQNIMRNVPTLLNSTYTNEEYLGTSYPLFFENSADAAQKLSDKKLVRHAYEYLRDMDKTRFSLEFFLRQMQESEIFRSTPSPLMLI